MSLARAVGPQKRNTNSTATTGHAGLVLAAGASTRMGSPKALLETPTALPLAQHQANLLRTIGCDPVLVVVGAEGERVAAALANCEVVENPSWKQGRITSVKAGLRSVPENYGCMVLPVDTVPLKIVTLGAVKAFAETHDVVACRPHHLGTRGHVVWLSPEQIQRVLQHESHADTRLDELLAAVEVALPVDDPAVYANVNTPEAWEAVKRAWPRT